MRGHIIVPAGVAAAIFLTVACASASADEDADRAKLVGTWEMTGPDAGVVWAIVQNGDQLRITQSHKDQPVSLLECSVGGRECEVKDNGHNAKISMWYNGGKLVEMETRGSEVVKRRFTASDDALEIEVIPIVPDGKPQVLKLKRTKAAVAHP